MSHVTWGCLIGHNVLLWMSHATLVLTVTSLNVTCYIDVTGLVIMCYTVYHVLLDGEYIDPSLYHQVHLAGI